MYWKCNFATFKKKENEILPLYFWNLIIFLFDLFLHLNVFD